MSVQEKGVSGSTQSLGQMDVAHLIHPGTSIKSHAKNGPIVMVEGSGAKVKDEHGKEYIDAYACMGALLCGHGRTEIAEAIGRQAATLAYSTSYYGFSNPQAILLAEKLASIAPRHLNKVYFASGGSESNESAFKIARYYFSVAGQPAKNKIISRRLGYHGLTIATMTATGMPSFRERFGPPAEGFRQIAAPYCYRCEFGKNYPGCDLDCAGALEKAILSEGPETVAAFIAEPVFGVGGHIIPPPEYFPRIREICDRYNVLLIADEVVCGFGRTGKLFGMEHWGVEPDLMTMAKGLTSGYQPLGAVMIHDKIYDAILHHDEDLVFSHGFTYSGHPTCCAAGLKNLEIIEREGLVQRSAEMGSYMLKRLEELKDRRSVGEVRGLGMLAAVELVQDKKTRAAITPRGRIGNQISKFALERGVICRPAGDTIALRPPLVITKEEMDRVIDVVSEAIAAVEPQL